MTRKDISNTLVSGTYIKRQPFPLGFGFVAPKERNSEDIKRRNTAHSSVVQIRNGGGTDQTVLKRV